MQIEKGVMSLREADEADDEGVDVNIDECEDETRSVRTVDGGVAMEENPEGHE